jgi:hypothetical protein
MACRRLFSDLNSNRLRKGHECEFSREYQIYIRRTMMIFFIFFSPRPLDRLSLSVFVFALRSKVHH